MEISIKSPKLNKTITFTRPSRHYIFADLNGKEGTLGEQICEGGFTSGSTISYSGDNFEEFAAICRKWYTSYIRSCSTEEYGF